MMASVGFHALVMLLAWWTQMEAREPVEYLVYQISLVSPPAGEVGEFELDPTPPDQLVIERPQDDIPPPVEEAPPPPPPVEREVTAQEEPPRTEVVQRETPPPPTREEQAEEVRPPRSPEADPTADVTGEGINVRMEGLRRDYPVYYENIIRQIARCFRWTQGGNWQTTVRFVIQRNGTVGNIQVVRRSGNVTFDIEAEGAVECAGAPNRLGELPEDLPWDLLPVEFNFSPSMR